MEVGMGRNYDAGSQMQVLDDAWPSVSMRDTPLHQASGAQKPHSTVS